MKFKSSKIVLIAMLCISLASCGQKQNENSTAQDSASKISLISPEALNSANKDILLIDVRTPEEYASGHLENSININFRAGNFKDLIAELDTNQDVYVYCKVGGRSASAARLMEDMGFKKIYDLKGGIIQWEKDGFKKVK
jgi:rhodanese-related sulfurtransferase